MWKFKFSQGYKSSVAVRSDAEAAVICLGRLVEWFCGGYKDDINREREILNVGSPAVFSTPKGYFSVCVLH